MMRGENSNNNSNNNKIIQKNVDKIIFLNTSLRRAFYNKQKTQIYMI